MDCGRWRSGHDDPSETKLDFPFLNSPPRRLKNFPRDVTRPTLNQIVRGTVTFEQKMSTFTHRPCSCVTAGKFGDSWKMADVAAALGVSLRTIEHLKPRFVKEGVEAALARNPQSNPRAVNFDGALDARLTALLSSDAPAGRQRWTVRLLAEKLVELKIADHVSTMTVQRSLKK